MFAPGQCVQNRGRCRAEQCAAEGGDGQAAAGQALAEGLEDGAQPVLQHAAGVVALVQMAADQGAERLVGGKRLAPKRRGGEAEAAAGGRGTFQFQHEQQTVDQDQPFLPQRLRRRGMGGIAGDNGAEESLDGAAGLGAQFFRDAGLRQAGGLQDRRQGRDAGWGGQSGQQAGGVRRVLGVPTGQRQVEGTVGRRRVAQKQTQRVAVGQDAGPVLSRP